MIGSVWLFAAFLAVIGLLRLVEVAAPRARAARAAAPAVAEPWLFPLMAALHAALVTLPLVEVLVFARPFSWAVSGPAIAVLVLATALRFWTLATLGRAWNVRVVVPSPDQIVTTGPYAWIRHPNYLVVILEVAAIPLVHSAWIAAIALSALNAFVLWHRIRTEEAALATLPGWSRAMADKKRLVPFLF